jgi:hypothetical protein
MRSLEMSMLSVSLENNFDLGQGVADGVAPSNQDELGDFQENLNQKEEKSVSDGSS